MEGLELQKLITTTIKDTVVHAVQSTKQENSGLVKDLNKFVADLDKKVAVINEILSEQNKTLERIEVQTTKHNGRMRDLELWRSGTVGAISVLGLVGMMAGVIWNMTVSGISESIAQIEVQHQTMEESIANIRMELK